MTTQLTKIDYNNKEVINTLKQTVTKGASDAELAMFIEMCRATQLNPFKKEIWFIKAKDQVQMMTGINGFYAIANSHPQYDGTVIDYVEQDGNLQKVVAHVYRKDRKYPSTAEAYLTEYQKPYGNWKIMPRVMLAKCAESMALRKAFPQELNGLYTQEEVPQEETIEHIKVDAFGESKHSQDICYDFSAVNDEQKLWIEEHVLQHLKHKKIDDNKYIFDEPLKPLHKFEHFRVEDISKEANNETL